MISKDAVYLAVRRIGRFLFMGATVIRHPLASSATLTLLM